MSVQPMEIEINVLCAHCTIISPTEKYKLIVGCLNQQKYLVRSRLIDRHSNRKKNTT